MDKAVSKMITIDFVTCVFSWSAHLPNIPAKNKLDDVGLVWMKS